MPAATPISGTTTPIALFAVIEICQNLGTMLNNMRNNISGLQGSLKSGTLTVTPQQAVADLGTAFQQRLTANQNVLTQYSSTIQNSATTLGVSMTDLNNLQSALVQQASAMQNNTVVTQSDMDTFTSNVLSAVPVSMLPF